MATNNSKGGGTYIFGNEVGSKLIIPKGASQWDVESLFKKDQYDNVVLMSFNLSDQETIDIRRCFDETTHIFAFGRNASASVFEMTFALFLYNKCKSEKWLTIDELNELYEDARVYKKQESLKIQVDDAFNTRGFLVRLMVGDINPLNKVAAVKLTFISDKGV